MLDLVNINGCNHVYDSREKRFIKSHAINMTRTLDIHRQQTNNQWHPSRTDMLRRTVWIKEVRQRKPFFRACCAREAESLMNSGDGWLTLQQVKNKNEHYS